MSDTYTKFRNEVMAGGADSPELEPTAGGPTAIARTGRHRRPAGRAVPVEPVGLRLRHRPADLDLPPRARPLRHRPLDRHEGHPVLPVHGPEAVELPPRRDRVRRARLPRRRLRADHRDEQPRRGRSGRRAACLPQQELPATHARDHRRLGHAHDHRHRAALRRVRRQRAAGRDRASRHRQHLGRLPADAERGRGRRHRPVDRRCAAEDARRVRRPASAVPRAGRCRSTLVLEQRRHGPDQGGRPRLQPERRARPSARRSSASARAPRSAGTTSRSPRPLGDSVTDLGPPCGRASAAW